MDTAADNNAKVRDMYHKALNREPSPKELDMALSYLQKGSLAEYAQALLSTNEVIFWP